jgi:hypothetical protein
MQKTKILIPASPGCHHAQAIRMLTIEETERWEILQTNAAAQQVRE